MKRKFLTSEEKNIIIEIVEKAEEDVKLSNGCYTVFTINNNKYTLWQLYKIREGLNKGIDVSWYADSQYDDSQMRQILWGLEKELDVSQYAHIKYDYRQMSSIRERLAAEKKHLNEAPDKSTQFPSLPF